MEADAQITGSRSRRGGNKGKSGEKGKRGRGKAGARAPLLKLLNHSARITVARMGDFARPLYPYIGRLLRAVAGHAAKETTRRNFVKASGGMCEA